MTPAQSPARTGRATAGRTRRLREVGLTAGAILGVVCALAASASMFLGVTPLVFRSGSMAPTIPTGSFALARPAEADQVEAGDIVSVVDSADVHITHRVTAVEAAGEGRALIRMRGDANDAEDPTPYVVSEVDRVFVHVPHLGYVVAWLSHPVAIFLGGMIAGGLVVIAFARQRDEEAGA